MILGFAHITKNDAEFAPSLRCPPIRNAPEKWPLMERRPIAHCIKFGLGKLRLPVEVVSYDTGALHAPGRLGAQMIQLGGMKEEGRVRIAARDVDAETSWFCDALGFECTTRNKRYGHDIRLTRPVTHWGVWAAIRSDPEAPIDPPLDIADFAALAFYSSNVEADRDRAITAGGRDPTDPFTVKLDREMKIIMLRSPEGTIIELIEVRT
jgi:hypothetical protein